MAVTILIDNNYYNYNNITFDHTISNGQIFEMISWLDGKDGLFLMYSDKGAADNHLEYIEHKNLIHPDKAGFIRVFYEDNSHPDVVEFKLTWL